MNNNNPDTLLKEAVEIIKAVAVLSNSEMDTISILINKIDTHLSSPPSVPPAMTWEECFNNATFKMFNMSPDSAFEYLANASLRPYIDKLKDLEIALKQAAQLYLESNRQQRWIPVEERPLYITTELGWECTEAADKPFIAAISYSDSTKPGKICWWIHHCVVEDGTGLCIVGEDDNEPAGWNLEDVLFYFPLLEVPKR